MTKRQARLLALGFFLASPLSCVTSFSFTGSRAAPIFWGLSVLAAALPLFGVLTLLARPTSEPVGWKSLAAIVAGALVGATIVVGNTRELEVLVLLIGGSIGALAGSLLVYFHWISTKLVDDAAPPAEGEPSESAPEPERDERSARRESRKRSRPSGGSTAAARSE